MLTNADLNIIIGVSAIAIASLAYVNKLATINVLRRVKYRWVLTLTRSTKFKVAVTVVAGVIGILASIEKDNIADEQRAKDFKVSEVNQRVRQKNHEADLKQLSEDNLKNFGAGLAKYYLKYDSVSKEVKKIVRDSSKLITNFQHPVPELDVTEIHHEIKGDTTLFNIILAASQAAAYQIKARTYLVVRDHQDNLGYIPLPYDIVDFDLKLDNPITITRTLLGSMDQIKRLYILITGVYSDRLKKGYEFNILTSYILKTDQVIVPTIKESAWIINFYKKQGILIYPNK